jgi:hypothetical protein
MSTYQIVLRSTTSAFQGFSIARTYERFLDWWASLYASPSRNLPPYL